MFDTTIASGRLPSVGSLKMALLETVWLRRETAEFLEAQAIATGAFNAESTIKSLAQLSDTKFPWIGKLRAQRDEKIHRIMKKWTESGQIEFKVPVGRNPLKDKAKQMMLPDDFKKKLRERGNERRKV